MRAEPFAARALSVDDAANAVIRVDWRRSGAASARAPGLGSGSSRRACLRLHRTYPARWRGHSGPGPSWLVAVCARPAHSLIWRGAPSGVCNIQSALRAVAQHAGEHGVPLDASCSAHRWRACRQIHLGRGGPQLHPHVRHRLDADRGRSSRRRAWMSAPFQEHRQGLKRPMATKREETLEPADPRWVAASSARGRGRTAPARAARLTEQNYAAQAQLIVGLQRDASTPRALRTDAGADGAQRRLGDRPGAGARASTETLRNDDRRDRQLRTPGGPAVAHPRRLRRTATGKWVPGRLRGRGRSNGGQGQSTTSTAPIAEQAIEKAQRTVALDHP